MALLILNIILERHKSKTQTIKILKTMYSRKFLRFHHINTQKNITRLFKGISEF